MVIVEKHRAELEALDLATVAGAKAFQGNLVKNHQGRRNIFRVPLANADGTTLLFLKPDGSELAKIPGYLAPDELYGMLLFVGSNAYEKMTFEQFKTKDPSSNKLMNRKEIGRVSGDKSFLDSSGYFVMGP